MKTSTTEKTPKEEIYYFNFKRIMERYDCGEFAARNIIQSIRLYVGKPLLPVGKVLPSELYAWEQQTGGGRKRVDDALQRAVNNVKSVYMNELEKQIDDEEDDEEGEYEL